MLKRFERKHEPILDPRVEQIAYDDSLSVEDRQRMLDELELTEEHDLENRADQQEFLEMARRARVSPETGP